MDFATEIIRLITALMFLILATLKTVTKAQGYAKKKKRRKR